MSGGVLQQHTLDGGAAMRSEITTLLAVFALLASLFAGIAAGVQLLQQRMDCKQRASLTHSSWEVECMRASHKIMGYELHEDAMHLYSGHSSATAYSDSSRSSSDSDQSLRYTSR